MKRFCILLLALTLVLGLGQPVLAQTNLTVLWFNDANESEVFLETVADFKEAHPDIAIEMQVIAFDGYENQLKLMIAGGNAPDLARMTTALMPTFVDNLEPLETYADIAAIEAAFAPSMLAYTTNSEGKIAAYPTEATANGMLVNKTAFQAVGIDVVELSKTWTWAEWEEAAKKVISSGGSTKYGLAVDFTPHRLSTILYQFGGRMMNEDFTKVNFSNEGTINALNWFKRMHDEGLIPPSVWMGSENAAELFQAGLVACHIGGSWNINTYSKITDFEWQAVPAPAGTMRSSVPGGKFIASFKDSANKEAAAQLMAWFSDAEHNAKYCLGTYNLSSRIDVSVEYPANTDSFATFADELKVTPTYTAQEWKSPLIGKSSSIIKEQVVQMLLGTQTVEETVAAIDRMASEL